MSDIWKLGVLCGKWMLGRKVSLWTRFQPFNLSQPNYIFTGLTSVIRRQTFAVKVIGILFIWHYNTEVFSIQITRTPVTTITSLVTIIRLYMDCCIFGNSRVWEKPCRPFHCWVTWSITGTFLPHTWSLYRSPHCRIGWMKSSAGYPPLKLFVWSVTKPRG